MTCYLNIKMHSVNEREIVTCPNIDVEINGTDKFPFFIRLYQVKEEDKKILDKEIKRLLLRNIKKRFIWHIPVQLC